MSVFDEINDLSAEMVLSRINLPAAKDGKSYICPLCKNGTGDTGDGIRPRVNSKGKTRWKCHKCGVDFSNFDLAAATLGLDAEREKSEAAKRLKEEFGITDDGDNFSFSRDKKSARHSASKGASSMDNRQSPVAGVKAAGGTGKNDEKKSATPNEPKNYSKLYKYCRENYDLKKFVNEQGGKWRGLTFETLSKAGCLYHGDFFLEQDKKAPVVIFPYDDEHYFARAVDGKGKGKGGTGAGLYVALPVVNDSKFPNFIVESEIDALSVKQAFSTLGDVSIGCIATGSVANFNKVVPELEKQFGNAEIKPKCVVMFDNDEAGNTKGLMLANELKAAGYPAEIFFLEERLAGSVHEYSNGDGTTEKVTIKKLDANDLLQQGGDKLFRRLIDGIEQTEWGLKAQASVMKKSAEQARQAAMDKSGIKIFSFAEYFAADFFSDIALTAKYSERKTGFENIDAAQIFMPALYVLGGLPATGKTTFAWQLLNQLADNGEPCIYCSYEMSHTELLAKSMSRELYKRYPEMSERLNLSSANIRRGACSGAEELHKQAATFARSSTNLRVAELSNTGIAELIEKLKPLVADVDKSSVICLDYLQIVPSKDARTSSAKEKVDDIMLRLKDFQRETNSTLIVISSFNRENYFQPVSFSSFKESGAIEYSADCIWGLENYGVDEQGKLDKEEVIKMSKEKVRKIKFSCLKNRNGGQYECFFRYHAAHDYFELFEEKKERPSHER